MISSLLLSLFAAHSLASPVADRQASGPSVKIQHGTVVGSSSEGIDSFKGIPFAKPPVGNLRLRPPQPITANFGTFTATGTPVSCPQFVTQANTSSLPDNVLALLADAPLVQNITDSGEDCLTVNVQRPSTATSSSKLPVLFWIYGGGFETGSTQMYDATSILQKSIALNEPVVYVSVNYRLGGFGFLAGKELSSEKSTNLGLRDQRLGLQWVQQNIAAFGGDPTKVTIWGESAGAISVFDHLLINGGDNTFNGKPLFRGAIMDSGTAVSADTVRAPQAQAVYDTVVRNAGCGGASDTLACLRSKDYTTFLNAANSVPGIFSYSSLDLAYLPRPDPVDTFFALNPPAALEAGKFTKLPMIIGDQEDEGTLFSLVQSNVSTNAQAVTYITSYFPTVPNARTLVTELLSLYPDQPLLGQPAGSPFNTGSLNNIYPQFKRIAAVLGDITFTMTRRNVLANATDAPSVKAWSYLNSYLYGTPVLGTFHGTDLLITYGTLTELPQATSTIQQYYVNFVNNLNPNVGKLTASTLLKWPTWTNASPNLLNFQAVSNKVIQDTFRSNVSTFLQKYGTTLKA